LKAKGHPIQGGLLAEYMGLAEEYPNISHEADQNEFFGNKVDSNAFLSNESDEIHQFVETIVAKDLLNTVKELISSGSDELLFPSVKKVLKQGEKPTIVRLISIPGYQGIQGMISSEGVLIGVKRGSREKLQ
jgi:hypothetical protein